MEDKRVYAETIAQNLAHLEARVAAACEGCGRPRQAVSVLAVSKFNPLEAVLAAREAGQCLFGENRVQEAQEKFGPDRPPLLSDSQVHLLGHLQSNKAKKAVQLFDCIQSVDSTAILLEINKQAERLSKVQDLLLELHTGEESKSGFADLDSLLAAVDLATGLPAIRLRGLMTMAPFTNDTAAIRASFVACREAFERVGQDLRLPAFDILSMGMTNDFELAIEEGATLLRIGTAIFGARQ